MGRSVPKQQRQGEQHGGRGSDAPRQARLSQIHSLDATPPGTAAQPPKFMFKAMFLSTDTLKFSSLMQHCQLLLFHLPSFTASHGFSIKIKTACSA